MKNQCSKLYELFNQPTGCEHNPEGTPCMDCQHKKELAVKDVRIAELEAEVIRMDDALADALIEERDQDDR